MKTNSRNTSRAPKAQAKRSTPVAKKMPPTARKVTPAELRKGIIAWRRHWTGSLLPVYRADDKKKAAWKKAAPVRRHKKLVELNGLYHDANEYRDKVLPFETHDEAELRRNKWSIVGRLQVPKMATPKSIPADWKPSAVKLRVTKDGVRFI